MGTNKLFIQPGNSPFTNEQAFKLHEALSELSTPQLQWLSGYLVGVASQHEAAPAAPTQTPAQAQAGGPPVKTKLAILYGTETGNAKKVAEQLNKQAKEKELDVSLADLGDYKKNQLKKEDHIAIVTATHGEGDPPEPVEEFYEFLHSKKAPKLEGTKFAVLSLGDSSYEDFCQTGKDFDARLGELGAERLIDRVDCDVDFEDSAEEWIKNLLEKLGEDQPSNAAAGDVYQAPINGQAPAQPAAEERPKYSKKNPFYASVLEKIKLNGRGSKKETQHFELSLEDSGITYEPGDSLGIVPQNNTHVVAEVILALGLDSREKVQVKEGEFTLFDALQYHTEITAITKPFLQNYAELTGSQQLKDLLNDPEKRREYSHGREIIDVIEDFPAQGIKAQEFIDALRPLPPRLYSIASSQKANPDEVHLTIAPVRYRAYERNRHGVASTHLSDVLNEGDTVGVYVAENERFRLPDDDSAPIIMVGPGTGIAPFRAFLEERQERGATGKNWLFFGEQHFRTDFLYQVEWQKSLKEGLLTRMDVAFSRDEEQKVYVQHRMEERSQDLYAWLQEGAYFYVCGDAEFMAPAVEAALTSIVEREGNMSREKAEDYIKNLQREKRYLKDVY